MAESLQVMPPVSKQCHHSIIMCVRIIFYRKKTTHTRHRIEVYRENDRALKKKGVRAEYHHFIVTARQVCKGGPSDEKDRAHIQA